MARPKSITTPLGTAVYPHLHAPDTKFDAAGVYTLKLDIPLSEAQPLLDSLEAMQQKALEEAKEDPKNKGKRLKLADLPFVVDEENQIARINFKMKATGTKKDGTTFTQAPALFDAKGTRLPADTRVGGGSKVKVAFEPSPFFTLLLGAGVSLRLRAVQVIDLQQFGGGSAESYGFGEEEGFSASADAEEAGFTTDTTTEPQATNTKSASDF